jgi:hypothetical protein
MSNKAIASIVVSALVTLLGFIMWGSSVLNQMILVSQQKYAYQKGWEVVAKHEQELEKKRIERENWYLDWVSKQVLQNGFWDFDCWPEFDPNGPVCAKAKVLHEENVKQTKILYTKLIWIREHPTTICADGWVSHSTGRGTCSHHGGIG